MNQPQKTRFRAAHLIREVLVARRRDPASILLSDQHWADCVYTFGQITRATKRGWHLAAAQLQQELLRVLQRCTTQLHELSRDVQELGGGPSLPTIADLYRELAALDTEFDEVQYDLAVGELAVTTPIVELEGVYLGPFQIRLDWKQLTGSSPYRVVALEPNPAVCNAEVTHPHVNCETLCEGDGRRSIRAALAEGRLADFFLLVWRLLDTYAPGRAYVELCDWNGRPCQECGTSIDEDDRVYCSKCDDLLCSDCTVFCPHCDRDFCGGCISACCNCRGITCEGCRQACVSCRTVLCPGCLHDGECKTCQEREEELEEGPKAPECHEEKTTIQNTDQIPAALADIAL